MGQNRETGREQIWWRMLYANYIYQFKEMNNVQYFLINDDFEIF